MSTPSDFPENATRSRHGREDKLPADIVVECDLPDPPEKVWRALTVPELLAAWLMPNDIRPRVGERFSFQAEPAGVARPATRKSASERRRQARRIGDSVHCEVLEAEPNRLLRYRWSVRQNAGARERRLDSIVSFELTPTPDGGTHLRLVHGEFHVVSVIRMPARATPAGSRARKEPIACAGCAPIIGRTEAMAALERAGNLRRAA
jgi:uncharacterized protein YndB with AHSA1/START domain